MASACVVNNHMDLAIDAKMTRTKQRALVTGIISPTAALSYAVVLGLLGFGLLAYFTNSLTVAIGAVGFIDYVWLYGYTKRRSVHSTLVGAISGATPPVAGYCAVTGRLDQAALLLFLILGFWQMAHFYAIAIFRRKEYQAASIPLLSIVKGVPATKRQITIYILLFLAATSALWLSGHTGISYLIVMVLVSSWWLRVSLSTKKSEDAWARSVFGSSLVVLMTFSLMISLNAWLP